MRLRGLSRLYNLVAGVWLLAAALSLALPDRVRLGRWLPLHLALVGAVSVAISGNMQAFAAGLSFAPDPPRPLSLSQFFMVNLGSAGVTLGMVLGSRQLLVGGGAVFASALILLGYLVLSSWLRGVGRKHTLPLLLYGGAILAGLSGVGLGLLLGGAHLPVRLWLSLRRAHLFLNLLGWVSLTIVGTLVIFLPTVLRMRPPAWRGKEAAGLLASGLLVGAIGLAGEWRGVALAGVALHGLGSLLVLDFGVRSLVGKGWARAGAAGKHLVAAVVWYAAGSWYLFSALFRGGVGLDYALPRLLAMLVGGWILQCLLGAWLYLLPVGRPGLPSFRKRYLAVAERGAGVGLLLLNGGFLLLATAGLAGVPPWLGWGLAPPGAAWVTVRGWVAGLAGAPGRAGALGELQGGRGE